MAAITGVVIHTALYLVWDVTPWLLGISAVHLLFVSMVVAERDARFPAAAAVFDTGVAVALAAAAGDARVAVPWLLVLIPILLIAASPRVALVLMTLVPIGAVAAWVAVDFVGRRPVFVDSRLATYLVLAGLALVVVVAVLIVELGGSARSRAGEVAERIRQLELVTEASSVGLAVQDLHRRFVYANQAFCEMVGLDERHVRERGLVDVIPTEALGRIEPLIVDAQLNRRSLRFEHPIKRADGTLGWLDVSMSRPVVQADGLPQFVFTALDSTDKITATVRALRLARALDESPDLVAVWDSLRRPLHVNQAFLDFFGATGRARDDAFEQIFALLDVELPQWSQLPAGSSVELEADLVRSGAVEAVPFSIVVTVAVEELEGGRSFGLVARNDSRRREASDQLREAVRARDLFVASVSNELRSPLSVVLGLATELASANQDFTRAEIAELSSLIAEQGDELARMVEDLLVAARADAGTLAVEPEDVVVGDIVRASIRSIPDDAAAVEMTPALNGVHVVADAGRLRQIMRNLLTNALRHGGGHIRVDAAVRDHEALVVVEDDGPVIDPRVQAVMFDAFGRDRRAVPGGDPVGLGLTVARQLARLMSGDLIYRREGGWSRFVLTLPLGATDLGSPDLAGS